MRIYKNHDLTKLNTLGVHAKATFFTEIENELDIKEIFNLKEFKENNKIFLGGGSNILFTKDFDGMVILNKLNGIEILKEDDEFVLIRCMSGVVWHDLVVFTVDRGFWGIENLALIPGTVGGAPVQNIGAYGVELKDVLESVEAYNVENSLKKIFSKEECEFGYRDSVFKNKFKGQYFISAITLKLGKKSKPNLSYKILSDYLKQNKMLPDSSKKISEVVSAIRKSKLPDPCIISNAGSFFKNVLVDEIKLKILLRKFPNVPYFKEVEFFKIPAAWLIEACGPTVNTSWRGKRIGKVGVHTEHALVLVNYGGGSGEELKTLADEITKSVFLKFDLKLIPEVNYF